MIPHLNPLFKCSLGIVYIGYCIHWVLYTLGIVYSDIDLPRRFCSMPSLIAYLAPSNSRTSTSPSSNETLTTLRNVSPSDSPLTRSRCVGDLRHFYQVSKEGFLEMLNTQFTKLDLPIAHSQRVLYPRDSTLTLGE
jgi:hypothetical protein